MICAHHLLLSGALLESEQISITSDTKGVMGKALADPEQLRRIFDNLLENSRKYGERIPLQIKITLDRIQEGFCISFLDNGVGVPEDKLPYLFDEFYQIDESRNRKEGNGLGLYIVKYLIEAMGGSVRAENAEGLVIHMEFPLSKKEGA